MYYLASDYLPYKGDNRSLNVLPNNQLYSIQRMLRSLNYCLATYYQPYKEGCRRLKWSLSTVTSHIRKANGV